MALLSLIGGYLFIFGARLADVSLGTVRFMLMIRGQRMGAAVIGFFEVLIWVLALGKVIESLSNPLQILVYSLGYASGIYVGQYIEERLAVGITSVQIIPRAQGCTTELVESLRAAGTGVTVLTGEGRTGPRRVLLVTVMRRRLPQVLAIAKEYDPDAFITVLDTRLALGGTLPHRR